MRLPHGFLKKITEITGFSKSYLSDLAAGRKRPGRKRSLLLEEACTAMSLNVPAELWLFGTSFEIKSALTGKKIIPRREKNRRTGLEGRNTHTDNREHNRRGGKDRRGEAAA
jgi:transcriptional regulator with XRE-family HTH domain